MACLMHINSQDRQLSGLTCTNLKPLDIVHVPFFVFRNSQISYKQIRFLCIFIDADPLLQIIPNVHLNVQGGINKRTSIKQLR